MPNRRRRKEQNNSKRYWLPILLGLASLWLLVSTIKGKSPTEVLVDTYHWIVGSEPAYLNRAELSATISDRDLKIDSLVSLIEEMESASPYRTAIVNTTANSLNLRAEPNLGSDVVIKIPDSSAVKILYFDEEVLVLEGQTGKWCKIQYADKEGWVWGNYLVLED